MSLPRIFCRPVQVHHGILVTLLVTHACLLLDALRKNFVTVAEVGHLAAGVSHWETGTYSMCRVNPPLPRMIATLPVVLGKPSVECIRPISTPGLRQELSTGNAFAAANADRYASLVFVARLAGIIWSVLGGVIVYCWSRELYGGWAGLVGLSLWCLGPNVLAHAQLITPDIPASVAALGATYVFWRYLQTRRWSIACLAGVLLGIAELTKFTLLILYLVWPILSIIYSVNRRFPGRGWPDYWREVFQLLLIVGLSVVVINVGYGFDQTGRCLGDIRFVSRLFAGEPPEGMNRFGYGYSGNRFRECWIRRIPVPLPAEYVRGIDVQRSDFEGGDRSYLAGEWRHGGWWYYYFYALIVKVPPGTWGFVLWALALTFCRRRHFAAWADELVLWLPTVCILALVSSQTGFNHHMRYILPVFPFAVVFSSKVACLADSSGWIRRAAIGVLVLSVAVSSSSVRPHYLSYFNEIAGGPENGHVHLLNSNIDCGQDLLLLKEWLEKHPEAKPLGLAYWNAVDPRVVGIEFRLPPLNSEALQAGGVEVRRSCGPVAGYFAVSVNFVCGSSWTAPDGGGGRETIPPGGYEYFRMFGPVAKAGHSILIYHISEGEARAARELLGLTYGNGGERGGDIGQKLPLLTRQALTSSAD